MTFATYTFARQDQIEEYAETLINAVWGFYAYYYGDSTFPQRIKPNKL